MVYPIQTPYSVYTYSSHLLFEKFLTCTSEPFTDMHWNTL